ncbi:MAG: ABC transporter permease, partial [Acidobacteria bacterium]|nr:ABC transporter permease [Acidobacteriota bacterium]
MWQDIRVALRGFRSAPAFTVTALVTLTLAIGANATIFSLVHALVLREANVRDPQSLVQVSSLVPPRNFENWLTYAIYDDFKQRQQVFSTVIGWRANDVLNIEGGGQRSRGLVATVSGNFFDELGARPALGRLLAADDLAEPSPDPAMVAVLGHAYWQRVFAGDPAAVGRRVVIEGVPLEIIGVAPPDFKGLSLFTEPDVTVPLTAYPRLAGHAAGSLMSSASAWVRTTGRLAPGVSIDQARAGINLLWRDLRAAHIPPSLNGARRDAFLAAGVSVRSAAYGLEAGPGLRERFTRPLILLLAIALLVLVIACLNLASLMVARGVAAGHAIAVRLALGAARFRVMRAIVIEGILLAIGGGLAGLLAAMWVSDALARLLLEDFVIPASLDVQPDLRVIGFTSLLILGGGSVCSLVAAWRASRQDVIVALRHDTRTSTG